MKFSIKLLIAVLIIAGLAYLTLDIWRAIKMEAIEIEAGEPEEFAGEQIGGTTISPEDWTIMTFVDKYPQYYSFKDMVFRVDAPVDGVRKITIEK